MPRTSRTVKLPPRRDPDRFSRRARRGAFAVALLSLFALIPVLAWFGVRAALDDRSGRRVSSAADPNAPGYQALVTSTPTLLLVELGDDRTLQAATLLAGGGTSGGAGALFIPGSLQVDPGAAAPRTVADVYATGGAEGTVTALEQLFHLGIASVATADEARWAQLVAPVGALTFDNSDELHTTTASGEAVTFAASSVTLRPGDVAAYLAARNPGEDERAHLYRHELFWRAWLAAVAKAGASPDAVPGETGSGLGAMVRAMSQAAVTYSTIPMRPVDGGSSSGAHEYAVTETGLPELLAELVPFPTSGSPGDRVKVRLLDGRGDRQVALEAAGALVPAGAEITVFGNADNFEYDRTEVRYYAAARRPEAEALAKAVGADEPVLQENQTDTVDVTVIIGRTFTPTGAKR